MKRFVAALSILLTGAPALAASWPGASPTGTAIQWGLNKTVTPYQIGVFLGTSWYSIGTITSGGVYLPTFTMTGDCSLSAGAITCTTLNGNAIGTSGTKIPLLSTANTWTLGQTFSSGATFSAATTFSAAATFSAGATFSTATTFSSTIAVTGAATLTGGATLGSTLTLNTYTIATLPTCNASLIGSIAIVSNGTAYATGTYGSAVSATGAVSRKVLCTNTGGATTYAWAYD